MILGRLYTTWRLCWPPPLPCTASSRRSWMAQCCAASHRACSYLICSLRGASSLRSAPHGKVAHLHSSGSSHCSTLSFFAHAKVSTSEQFELLICLSSSLVDVCLRRQYRLFVCDYATWQMRRLPAAVCMSDPSSFRAAMLSRSTAGIVSGCVEILLKSSIAQSVQLLHGWSRTQYCAGEAFVIDPSFKDQFEMVRCPAICMCARYLGCWRVQALPACPVARWLSSIRMRALKHRHNHCCLPGTHAWECAGEADRAVL